ncbi:lipase family protein [Paenibacillus antibioticophila]|uniref:lipase family protein n=1 Tax=Paenibacillus antibioticophila TaxID=1274374 RepID=UPI0005CA7F48
MSVNYGPTLEQRALFFAAICGQTYVQFNNPDGVFVVPFSYQFHGTIFAKSISGAKERFGFILESSEEIIIAFRGTSSAQDWISDFIASQKRYPYLKGPLYTHKGFTDIYASSRNKLIASIRKLPTSKKLYITGHSLGGALATLCALDLAANTSFTSIQLFTFGSPRVGDPAFSKACAQYLSDSYRIANLFDIVPLAPPNVYKPPRQEEVYYFNHVKSRWMLEFQNGSVSLNHVISSYYQELARQNPEYAAYLSRQNPGFCPQ